MDYDLETIRDLLRARAAEVAERLLGPPSYRSRREFRWGRRGSLALAIAGARAGQWYCHETGTGGDLFDLIQRERRCGFAKAVEWARYWTDTLPLPPPAQPKGKPPPPPAPAAPDDAEREAAALRLWREARESIAGTPGEVYLRGRGIDPARLPPHAGLAEWPPTLRWHAATGALLVAVNDATSGLARACQRIMLNADGTPKRRPDGSKIKLCLGPIGGRAVRFGWHPDPAGRWALAEGCETALAAAQLLGIPTWASLGASNLPRVTPPSWARKVTICADHDEPGLRAAQEAARRLRERGLEVRIVTPKTERADAADMLEVA